MSDSNTPQSDGRIRKWILLGIPVVFLLGGLTHFLYDFTGGNLLAGILRP
jgi:hypothetical protein